jgi:hypothetical protein
MELRAIMTTKNKNCFQQLFKLIPSALAFKKFSTIPQLASIFLRSLSRSAFLLLKRRAINIFLPPHSSIENHFLKSRG